MAYGGTTGAISSYRALAACVVRLDLRRNKTEPEHIGKAFQRYKFLMPTAPPPTYILLILGQWASDLSTRPTRPFGPNHRRAGEAFWPESQERTMALLPMPGDPQ